MRLKTYSVTEINKYIKGLFRADIILNNLQVEGEISNFKIHTSGHMYFSLKDDQSRLRCVMFKNQTNVLKFLPEEGMKVIIKGYISTYERDGQYQLYVQNMQPSGIGALYKAFEQLKAKLEEEGLFKEEAKNPFPFYLAALELLPPLLVLPSEILYPLFVGEIQMLRSLSSLY